MEGLNDAGVKNVFQHLAGEKPRSHLHSMLRLSHSLFNVLIIIQSVSEIG